MKKVYNQTSEQIPEAKLVLATTLQARKQLAKKIIFYIRNNKQCVRRYATPFLPGTRKQIRNWRRFRTGMRVWRNLPQHKKQYYNNLVKQLDLKMHGVNLFMSLFLTGKL